jgi:hypothetical protein
MLRPDDNHAYRALFRERTWEGARAACARTGGHLATLEDSAEIAFLAGRLYGTYWVGGTRTSLEGPFTWLDGQRVLHDLFGPDDPDVKRPTACLVLGQDYKLHDRWCDGTDAPGPNDVLCEAE